MDVVVERVAGLDIGKASMTVCVRTPGPGSSRTNEVRTYSTMTEPVRGCDGQSDSPRRTKAGATVSGLSWIGVTPGSATGCSVSASGTRG